MSFDDSYSFRNKAEETQYEETQSTDEEYDTEMFYSSEQDTEYEVFEETRIREGEREDVFKSQWEMEQRSQQYRQKMLLVPLSNLHAGFYNNSRENRISRNNARMAKVQVGYLIDDRLRKKRQKLNQNNFEEDSKPMNEKTNKNKSFVKTKIFITHEFKGVNCSSSTPMSWRDDFVIDDDTFEINENVNLPNNRSLRKAKKRHEKHKDKKRQRQEKIIRRQLREHRRETKRIEIRRQQNNLPLNIKDYPLLTDFSDDDGDYDDDDNDRLVIDEDKF